MAGHSVECVIDTTSRRDRRGARSRHRLDDLISETTGDRPAPSAPRVDPPWLDVSLDATVPGLWPDGGVPPPEAEPGPERDPTPDAGHRLPVTMPAAQPWWRRRVTGLLERWLPASAGERPHWRLAAVAAAGAVLLGVAVAVGLVVSGPGTEPEVPPALPAASVSEVRTPGGTSTAPSGGSIVISVVGRVAKPGLVTLPDGARVADALEATGGMAPGTRLGGLNLARRLNDGEQIYVGIPTPPNAGTPAGAPGAGQPGAGPVDLNAATLAALDTLPGVGPVTAQRILDWRTEHGRFASVDQLREVEGIGPTRFARLKDLVVAR